VPIGITRSHQDGGEKRRGGSLGRDARAYLDRHRFRPVGPRQYMRTIAQHHEPPRTLYDLALVEPARYIEAIIAIDHDLDAAAHPGTA
jgi:hypothetical protein